MVVVRDPEIIKLAVSDGQRPDITAVREPETLSSITKEWISRCWDQEPDRRPAFSGI